MGAAGVVRAADGVVIDVSWEAVHPDKSSEAGYSLSEMPRHVQDAFFKKIAPNEPIKVPKITKPIAHSSFVIVQCLRALFHSLAYCHML